MRRASSQGALPGRGAQRVIATGVSGVAAGGDQRRPRRPSRPSPTSSTRSRRRRRATSPRRPASATSTTRTSRCLRVGQRDAGVGGDGGDRARHPARPRRGCRPWRRPTPPRPAAVEERVTVEQAHHVLPPLLRGARRRAWPRAAWVSGWPSSPSRAVDDLDVRRGMHRRERRTRPGRRSTIDVGRGEQLDRTHRQQAGVAGAGADEGDGPSGRLLRVPAASRVLGLVHRTRSTSGRPHPRRASSAASSRPTPAGSRDGSGGGQPHRAEPSTAPTTPRRYSSGVLAVGRDVGVARPTGAEQPASSAASRARSAVTAARVRGSSSSASSATERRGVVGAALDRQRALAGGGQHQRRVEHLGDLVEPAEPGKPGAGEHDGVERRRRRPSRSRVSTLPRTATTSRPRPAARSWAARRGEPVPTRAPGGELVEGEAVAGDQHVARVLPRRHGGEREARRRRRSAGP